MDEPPFNPELTPSEEANTQGFRVGCKGEVLRVKDKDKLAEEVRLRDLSHVALFGNIQISTQAIQALCEQEIPYQSQPTSAHRSRQRNAVTGL